MHSLSWFQFSEIQQPSNLEKTSRHMANTRSTIAVAARSGSTIPSYRLNFTNTIIRSTVAVGGRFKTVALQRFLTLPIGFEISAQAGLAAIFCLFRSFRPKFYRTFCRSRQDLTIYARPVTRISETLPQKTENTKCNMPGRCPAYAGKIIPHPGTLKGVPRMGE